MSEKCEWGKHRVETPVVVMFRPEDDLDYLLVCDEHRPEAAAAGYAEDE